MDKKIQFSFLCITFARKMKKKIEKMHFLISLNTLHFFFFLETFFILFQSLLCVFQFFLSQIGICVQQKAQHGTDLVYLWIKENSGTGNKYDLAFFVQDSSSNFILSLFSKRVSQRKIYSVIFSLNRNLQSPSLSFSRLQGNTFFQAFRKTTISL